MITIDIYLDYGVPGMRKGEHKVELTPGKHYTEHHEVHSKTGPKQVKAEHYEVHVNGEHVGHVRTHTQGKTVGARKGKSFSVSGSKSLKWSAHPNNAGEYGNRTGFATKSAAVEHLAQRYGKKA